MNRICLGAILLVITQFCIAQKTSNKSKSIRAYGKSDQENFKALGLNWILSPSSMDALTKGLDLLGSGDWKPALKYFDNITASQDSSFIPAYYYREVCYYVGHQIFSNKSRNNSGILHKKLSGKTFTGEMSIYSDLWNLYIPGNHNRQVNPLLEITPPLTSYSQYFLQYADNIKPESRDLLRKSFSCLFIGNIEESISLANKSLQVEQSVCALYLKALAFQINSKHDSAFLLFDKIVKEDRGILEAHENLAIYKSRLNDRVGAIRHLNALNQIAPANPNVWRMSGLLKFEMQDYFGAILDLSKYLKADSTDFECLKHRAIALFETKDYQGALKDLDRTLSISINDLSVYFYKSDSYFKLGDSAKSVKVLRDAKPIFSFDLSLNLRLADKLIEVNETREAQKIIDNATLLIRVNNFKGDYTYEANVVQCKLYIRKGNHEKALQKLNSLIINEGEQPGYLFLRAKVYLLKNENTHARIDLEKLVKAGFKPALELYNNVKLN